MQKGCFIFLFLLFLFCFCLIQSEGRSLTKKNVLDITYLFGSMGDLFFFFFLLK